MGEEVYRNERYRQVGNQIEAILADLDLSDAVSTLIEPQKFIAILALVTLFQYEEGFTDVQAAEAVRMRSDWKYALGLPLSYPGFDPAWLCRFREHALQSEATKSVLQDLVDRVEITGGIEAIQDQAFRAGVILDSICRFNRIVQVTEAMLLAVEALVGWEPTWLCTPPLSHLYASNAKIFRTVREIRNSEEMDRLSAAIEADVAALLGSIDASGQKELKAVPEICNLRKIWAEQYDRVETIRSGEPAIRWRKFDCLRCSVKMGLEHYTLEKMSELS